MSEANTTVLVADDDSTIRRNLVRLLQSEGYQTIEAADGDEALAGVQAKNPDAVLLDLKMPGRDGLKVLAELQPLLADLPVIVVTALGGSAAAIEAMRRGAYDYLSKPFDLDEVLLTLKRALRQRALAIEVKALRARTKQNAAETQDRHDDEPELIGRSAAMLEVFKSIGLAAAMDAPVLIVGESGTGKELVAAALHRHSSRAAGPLIRVNCGALPDGLVESELFGHEKGAFTGADRQKPGRFERAAGGTLFLDEVGELPLSAQTKILRVLQQREFERVGGTETLRTDARVISATHRDLSREVAAGRFREDLFYRLNVARIVILPLRERPEDIGPLAEYILRRLEQRHGWRELSLSPQALQSIRERPWPGNVRQLENALACGPMPKSGDLLYNCKSKFLKMLRSWISKQDKRFQVRLVRSTSGVTQYNQISRKIWPFPTARGARTDRFLGSAGVPRSPRGRAILPEHLDTDESPDPALTDPGDAGESLPLRALLAEVERRAIERALLACGGNRTRTAERLGISRRQLFDKIREYDLGT